MNLPSPTPPDLPDEIKAAWLNIEARLGNLPETTRLGIKYAIIDAFQNAKETAAMNPTQPPITDLTGQFFHSTLDNQIVGQGAVLGSPAPGWYLVLLFGWAEGSPSLRRLVKFSDMEHWIFYGSRDEMETAYAYGIQLRKDEAATDPATVSFTPEPPAPSALTVFKN